MAALAIAGLFGAHAEAAPPPGQVSFSSTPRLSPTFGPNVHDYVVRCKNRPVTVRGHTSGDWEMAVDEGAFRSGNFSEVVPLSAGRAVTITVRQVGSPQRYRYYARCLPKSFPTYTFTRYRPVSPQYFSVDRGFACGTGCYGIIFNNHGVPIWWYHGRTWATRVLPNGNILWFERNRSPSRWATHGLNGARVRTLNSVGWWPDSHDLQLLGNGNHLVGGYVEQEHVDTSAYGGSRDATVINTELQEVDPQGGLIWRWKSQHHIARAETGHHWPRVIQEPGPRDGYDILHWNSIERAGNSVIASFRHLDAVYKIDKSTGQIVWKLGGTRTPRSLTVRNDPRAYTFGAQHDARLLPDGTITVFDNRTYLGHQRPRAVRFRIDEQARTATLLQSITDPAASSSRCCGSARRLANGHWLIYWGGGGPSNLIGGYRPGGQRTFSLSMGGNYRAEPVPVGVLSAQDLRQAMDAMYGAP